MEEEAVPTAYANHPRRSIRLGVVCRLSASLLAILLLALQLALSGCSRAVGRDACITCAGEVLPGGKPVTRKAGEERVIVPPPPGTQPASRGMSDTPERDLA
ncbi:hypothetical protein CFR79_13815 [Komagataeibacter saccharivorans]|nr:hypothetical protein CFR79_13815 [Komagataeibacter saccharivorans]GBQ37630.1 hypothetical protein AA0614_1104 [Komagataeibacter saccharivorans NRIC 0614]